jgi:hypothetical protein
MNAVVPPPAPPASRTNGKSGPSAGTIRRRRPLPTGRAVVGGVLVAIAIAGVFGTWVTAGGGRGQPYIVARHLLPPGTVLRADDVAVTHLRLPAGPVADHAFHSPGSLMGRVLLAPVGAGELVQASAVLGPGQGLGQREVSLTVDPTDTTGLQLGQLIDVLVTHGNADAARTDLVVAGARLLRTARTDNTAGIGGRSGEVITLAVDNFVDVQAVIQASRAGQVDVVAGAVADAAAAGPPTRPPAPNAVGP